MHNEQPQTKKQFLSGSRNRLMVFIVGLAVLIIAGGFFIFSLTELSKWKETSATSSTNTGDFCSKGRGSSGHTFLYAYEVDGQQYTHEECITGPGTTVRTISYNPANPSQSLFNIIGAYQYIALGVGILGLVVMLGGLFATDTQKSATNQVK